MNPSLSFFSSFRYNSIDIIMLFLLLYLLHNNKSEDKNKYVTIVSGLLIGLLHLIGYGIFNYNSLNFLLSCPSCFIKSILKLLYYSYIYYNISLFIYNYISSNPKIKYNVRKEIKLLDSSKKSFIIRMILFLLAFIPFFLNEYPGTFTVDSISEMYSAINQIDSLVNHHPVLHIYIISLFLNIGLNLFKSLTVGIAFYSIAQMIFTAFTFSYIIYFLSQEKINDIIKLITFLFFLLYPPFAAYSITMWKDIPFALTFIYFSIQIIKIFGHDDYLSKKTNVFKVFISAIMFILFKNNGIYVVVLSFLIYVLFYKKEQKKLFTLLLMIISFYAIWTRPVFKLLNVSQGPVKESLSVPIQQLSRTYVYRKNKLTSKEKKIIKSYIQNEDIEKNYYPFISDNMKETFNDKLFKKNKMDFFKIWISLFFKYPDIYFESYFLGSIGYWYPEVDNYIIEDWFDYDSITVIKYEKKPLVKIALVDKMKYFVNSRKIPILSIFFSIGFYFWILLLNIGLFVYNKKYNYLYIFMPVLFLWLTTTASPVWCEFRYIYPMIMVVPVLLSYSIGQFKKVNNTKKKQRKS